MCRLFAIWLVVAAVLTGAQLIAADPESGPESDQNPHSESDPDFAALSRRLDDQSELLDEQRELLRRQQAELKTLRAASEPPSPAAPATSGYDKGFFIRSSPDPKQPDAIPFLLRVNSRSQLRHTLFDSDGANADQNDFEFERLRLAFTGHAWTQELEWFFQLDADSDQSETVDMLDYFVTYDLADVLDLEPGHLAIRGGKWKMPFNRSRSGSGFKQQFVDRALASGFFDINRSIGVGLILTDTLASRPLTAQLALHNGLDTGGFQPVRSGQLDRNFGVSGRIVSDLLGDWGSDGEVDLTPHDSPAIRIGAGFAWMRVDTEGRREFQRQQVVDSGATLASLLPAGVTAYDVAFQSLDANLKYKGLSVLTEYYFRQINDFDGATLPALSDHGFMAQAGCFVVPGRLELAARFSRIVGDSGTLGGSLASADEVACGINCYFRGHNAKLQFDVTHLNGSPLTDRALNILAGDSGILYRTQFQLVF